MNHRSGSEPPMVGQQTVILCFRLFCMCFLTIGFWIQTGHKNKKSSKRKSKTKNLYDPNLLVRFELIKKTNCVLEKQKSISGYVLFHGWTSSTTLAEQCNVEHCVFARRHVVTVVQLHHQNPKNLFRQDKTYYLYEKDIEQKKPDKIGFFCAQNACKSLYRSIDVK